MVIIRYYQSYTFFLAKFTAQIIMAISIRLVDLKSMPTGRDEKRDNYESGAVSSNKSCGDRNNFVDIWIEGCLWRKVMREQ